MKKPIRKELLDELLAEYANPDDLTGPDGLLKRLTGALVERALQTGTFEPQLVKKHQRSFKGFDDKLAGALIRHPASEKIWPADSSTRKAIVDDDGVKSHRR